MRKYEMLYILRPNLDEEQMQTAQNRIAEVIGQQGGQVEEVKEWGKKQLAFELADFREGYYFEVHFNGNPEVVEELDRVIKLTSEVLRHLVVREEE